MLKHEGYERINVMPKISVIVPIYNAEKYISNCIDSIINQTFTDFELVLVDDGSTDLSFNIIEKYLEIDNRLRLFQQTNKGAAAARNYGIKKSTGEYIVFVDADDTISKWYLYALYSALSIENADFACLCRGPCVECNDDIEIINKVIEERIVITGSVAIAQYEKYGYLICGCTINKLMKRTILENNLFVEGMIYEDTEALPRWLYSSDKIVIVKLSLYNYNLTENSVMRSPFSEKNFSILDMHLNHFNFFKQVGNLSYAMYSLQSYLGKLLQFSELVSRDKKYKPIFNKYLLGFKSHKWEYFIFSLKNGKSRIIKMCFLFFPMFPKATRKLFTILLR